VAGEGVGQAFQADTVRSDHLWDAAPAADPA
jgi:hypothetical protein